MSAVQSTYTVSAIGGSGPNSTSVFFMKAIHDGTEIRPWAWVPNTDAGQIVPGMTVTFEQVTGLGAEQTTYRKDGVETALKIPRRQVFWGGQITIDAPEQAERLPHRPAVVTEAAARYAAAYRNKQATEVVDGDEPI